PSSVPLPRFSCHYRVSLATSTRPFTQPLRRPQPLVFESDFRGMISLWKGAATAGRQRRIAPETFFDGAATPFSAVTMAAGEAFQSRRVQWDDEHAMQHRGHSQSSARGYTLYEHCNRLLIDG
ncbi:hypothetical protein BaRGS_00008237, partial [Batillaria attramentaria]